MFKWNFRNNCCSRYFYFFIGYSLSQEIKTNVQIENQRQREIYFDKLEWCKLDQCDKQVLFTRLQIDFWKNKYGNKVYSPAEYVDAVQYIISGYKNYGLEDLVWNLHLQNPEMLKVDIWTMAYKEIAKLYWQDVAENNDEIITRMNSIKKTKTENEKLNLN